MIICDEHEFVFVHIPKCAGSTVRKSIERCLHTESRFAGLASHPDLGELDMAHIPLSVLCEYFPDEYRKLETYESFAVVRDPFQRFPSSLFQRIRLYGDGPTESMTRKEFAQEVDGAIEFLARTQSDVLLPYDYIHFQRQQSFVNNGADRLVQTLFPLDRVADLFEYVGRLIGPEFKAVAAGSGSRENRSELFKADLLGKLAKPLLPFYSRSVKGWLPLPIRNRLSSLLLVDRSQRHRDVLDSVHVRQFIGDYYAEDIKLYDEVESQYSGAATTPD